MMVHVVGKLGRSCTGRRVGGDISGEDRLDARQCGNRRGIINAIIKLADEVRYPGGLAELNGDSFRRSHQSKLRLSAPKISPALISRPALERSKGFVDIIPDRAECCRTIVLLGAV